LQPLRRHDTGVDAFEFDAGGLRSSGKRQADSPSGRDHTRQRFDRSRMRRISAAMSRSVRYLVREWPGALNTRLRRETRIDPLQLGEAARQERCADREPQGGGNLTDHQEIPRAAGRSPLVAPRDWSALTAWNPTRATSSAGQAPMKTVIAAIVAPANISTGQFSAMFSTRGRSGGSNGTTPFTAQKASARPTAPPTVSSGSSSATDWPRAAPRLRRAPRARELALPGECAREQQVRQIRATDQQHRDDRGQQDVERHPHRGDGIGEHRHGDAPMPACCGNSRSSCDIIDARSALACSIETFGFSRATAT
jgi:hypothetical protein